MDRPTSTAYVDPVFAGELIMVIVVVGILVTLSVLYHLASAEVQRTESESRRQVEMRFDSV